MAIPIHKQIEVDGARCVTVGLAPTTESSFGPFQRAFELTRAECIADLDHPIHERGIFGPPQSRGTVKRRNRQNWDVGGEQLEGAWHVRLRIDIGSYADENARHALDPISFDLDGHASRETKGAGLFDADRDSMNARVAEAHLRHSLCQRLGEAKL